MRKDITKKLLGKEDRYLDKMLSKGIFNFIARRKINIDANQISYDVIEFMNSFRTKFTNLNTKNVLKSGDKIKMDVKIGNKTMEFNMIYCEKGKFEMGSNDQTENNPKKNEVIEKPFLLGETEVTQELYELVRGDNPSEFQGKKYLNSSQRPVEKVTWYDAIIFCNKLSKLTNKSPYYKIVEIYELDKKSKAKKILNADVEINEGANGFRLPYGKEWEYAAKAGTNNLHAGTNDDSRLEEYAWFGENSNDETHPVATKKPNEWGFYDMTGNVWEWCCDKSQSQSQSQSKTLYVSRGGGWRSYAPSLNSTYRSLGSPSNHNNNTGFRVSAYL